MLKLCLLIALAVPVRAQLPLNGQVPEDIQLGAKGFQEAKAKRDEIRVTSDGLLDALRKNGEGVGDRKRIELEIASPDGRVRERNEVEVLVAMEKPRPINPEKPNITDLSERWTVRGFSGKALIETRLPDKTVRVEAWSLQVDLSGTIQSATLVSMTLGPRARPSSPEPKNLSGDDPAAVAQWRKMAERAVKFRRIL